MEQNNQPQDVYSFGKCKRCKEIKALKNGYCIICEKLKTKPEMPDFLKDVFRGF